MCMFLLAQSCPTLCNPMDCSLPGPLSMGILQARILEWVAILLQGIFPTQGSNPGIPHWRQILTIWATRKTQEYWSGDSFLQRIILTQDSTRNWTGVVTWVYAPRFFVSSQQKFGVTDIEAPSAGHSSWRTHRVIALKKISVTAQCYISIYLDNSRKIHLQGMRARRSKDAKRRSPHRAGGRASERASEREEGFGSSFYFLFPLGLSYANWA